MGGKAKGSSKDRETPVVPQQFVSADGLTEQGRALRTTRPTDAHNHRAASPDRPGVEDFVRATHEHRLDELLPLRIGRMTSTPYTFFRGGAGLMAADLADSPTSGLTAQLCGDAHAANFGLYGTVGGDVVMDINDFDETAPGPWEWDLKRLAASLVLAGREAGVSDARAREAAEDAVKSYRRTVRELAEMPFLQSWTALSDESTLTSARADDLSEDFTKAVEKARRNTSAKVVAKSVEHIDDHEAGVRRHRFLDEEPVLWHPDDKTAEAVMAGVQAYVPSLRESRHDLLARYRMSDVAFRIVGTGSVGMRSYIVLLHGNHGEDLVLQVKQAGVSALAPYVDMPAASHEGQRIVNGARKVQAATDILLGWTTIDGYDYIVRQFRNMKGGVDPTTLPGGMLDDYGRVCGALLARAHGRSLHPTLLAGYLEDDSQLDESIGAFAVSYADQTEVDHAALIAAVKAGRLPTADLVV